MSITPSSDINITNTLAPNSFLEAILNDLKERFPNDDIKLYEEAQLIFFHYTHKKDTINFEIKQYNIIEATSEITNKSYKLEDIIKKCDNLPKHQIPAYVIDIFVADEFDDFVGEELNDENMGNKTDLYKNLRSSKNVENEIIFFSFGVKHDKSESVEQRNIVDKLRIPHKCNKTFDARRANAKHAPGHRGTEEILQKGMEAGSGYDNLMIEIVTHIDTYNSKVIGIYCSAGHHRSVALVELLKKYVYKNAIIKHLHINS